MFHVRAYQSRKVLFSNIRFNAARRHVMRATMTSYGYISIIPISGIRSLDVLIRVIGVKYITTIITIITTTVKEA